MKLTWFGGTTFRVHIGGWMIVVDAEGVPGSVDSTELVSGADMVFGLADDLPQVDARKWAPRKVGALIDEAAELPGVLVHRLGEAVVLVEAVGEAPLVIAMGEVPEAGRWGRDAVVIVAGKSLPQTAVSVVNEIGPRLIAIAGSEHAIEETIEAVQELLDGTGLMAMEPALALEV
jgi:hypothetical protein